MPTRRAVIARGGLAGAGVIFLWASAAQADSATVMLDAEAKAAGPVLAKTKSIPIGGGIIRGKYVVTRPSAKVFKCFSAICPHMGCTVGSVSGGTINCPCHGSKFSISTGAVRHGPAKRGLPRKRITVKKGVIRLA